MSLQATDTILVGSELGFSAISREAKLVANQNGSQNDGLSRLGLGARQVSAQNSWSDFDSSARSFCRRAHACHP